MRRLLFLLAAVILAAGSGVYAQAGYKAKGTVVDEAGEPLVGASVVLTKGAALGVTDLDGKFAVNVPNTAKTLTFSFIGYEDKIVPAQANMGTIELKPKTEMLKDVVVTQSLARTRQTPVAVSQVNALDIDLKLGGQELPEILKTTPGVWATKDGGGYGDAKINMRGFKGPNVAVLVNGIPVNDMEGGWVYWSNWAGLSDVTSNMQTQRGLGAAVLSSPSIGGTINITTASTDAKRGGSAWYGFGNDGMNQMGVKLSTGLMDNGWAITMLGSRRWGDGYVQGTFFNAYNYFLNVSKKINDAHRLSFTALGAPQRHNKRSNKDGLTIMGWQTYAKQYMGGEQSPYKYNATFGYDLDGQVRSSSMNIYHKPQVSLAHNWQITDKSALSTTLYASIASGGGYSGQGRDGYSNASWYGVNSGVLENEISQTFRNADGTFAYDKVQLVNQASTNGSKMVMSMSNNSHEWYGLVSTYTNRFLDNKLNVLAGVDMRYYVGRHDNTIIDLYNGQYFIDDNRASVKPENNINANNPEWVYAKLGVGDKVYRDYVGYTQQQGVYSQAELSLLNKRLTLVAAGSINNTGYKRRDNFYYDKAHGTTKTYYFLGGTVKGGANYNIDRHNNVFANVGFISRAPFFSQGVFLSQANSNAVNPNPINEKVYSAEFGYGYSSPMLSATVNGYYTKWLDKTTVRSGLIGQGPDRYVMNLSGVDARHMGIEFNFTYIPTSWLEVNGMLSLGDYIWDSNTKGYYYNMEGQPLKTLNTGELASGIMAEDHAWGVLNQKGVKVGGSAQTTGALGATFRPFKGVRIGGEWTLADRLFSDYSISAPSANSTIEVAKPWKVPYGQQVDLNASYSFKVGKDVNATLSGNVQNVFNNYYIVDCYTSGTADGNWRNAYDTFYNFGRTYSLKLKLNF